MLFHQALTLSKPTSVRYIYIEKYDANTGLLNILYWLLENVKKASSATCKITTEKEILDDYGF